MSEELKDATGGSSTAQTEPAQPVAASSADKEQAQSGSSAKTLADVVFSADAASRAEVGKSQEASGSESEHDGNRASQDQTTQEEPSQVEAKPEDDDSKLPFNDHPRWKEVYGKAKERDELEVKLREADGRMQAVKPFVEAQESVNAFCRENGITPNQYREALEIQALINRRPEEAMRRLEPLYNQLAALTGRATKFDPDLQEAIDNGKLDLEWAKTVQASRAKVRFSEAQQELNRSQVEQANQRMMAEEVSNWDLALRSKDTAFKPMTNGKKGKYELTMALLNNAWLETRPRNSVEAVRLAQQAYKDACDLWTQHTVPPKPTVKPLPTGGSSASTKKPVTSLQDVVFGVADGTIKVER